jgi:hypothetical protein
MIDDPPVDFLRNAIVVTTVAGLHVVDRDAQPCSDDRGEPAVGVAEDEDTVRALALEDLRRSIEDRRGLGRERCGAADTQIAVRLPHAELPEEHVAQLLVVVLAGMHQHLFAQTVERGNDGAQTDDLRPRAEERHHFHRATPSGIR